MRSTLDRRFGMYGWTLTSRKHIDYNKSLVTPQEIPSFPTNSFALGTLDPVLRAAVPTGRMSRIFSSPSSQGRRARGRRVTGYRLLDVATVCRSRCC
jgi:hypothetical protein